MTYFANQSGHEQGEACGNTQDWYKSKLDIEQFPNPTQEKEESDHDPEHLHSQGEILPHYLSTECYDTDAEKTSTPAYVGNEGYADPDKE